MSHWHGNKKKELAALFYVPQIACTWICEIYVCELRKNMKSTGDQFMLVKRCNHATWDGGAEKVLPRATELTLIDELRWLVVE